MAVPSYTTDLTSGVITTAESGTWGEITGYVAGGTPAYETDYYIQGTGCYSQSTGGKTGLQVSMYFDYGSDLAASITTGKCVFFWQILTAANGMDTFGNGGLRLGIGSSVANFKMWKSGGNDFGRNPYGGWQNIAIDPRYNSSTGDYTIGTPSGVWRYFGSIPNLTASIGKGSPHALDAIRYGRGQLTITGGTLGDGYATFSGLASTNDNVSNRWGLFAEQQGSYLWKGLISFGTTGQTVSFVDSNRTISIDACPRTYTGFNKMEIYNTGSTVTWSNITMSALDIPSGDTGVTTNGQLEVVENADVNFDGCTFSKMDTFIFLSNSSVTNTVFSSCKEITAGGGVFTGTKILTPTVAADTSALGWNSDTNPDGYLDNMIFTKGTNAHHAIEFGTSSPTTITLRGITFSGFNTSDSQNDSVLHILRTGGTVTIQAVECSGTITYKTAGATVSISQGVVTKVIVKDIDTGNAIEDARVLLKVADSSNFPYNASVSITSSGTTATVTHANHGLKTGDKVIISGVNSTTQDPYNGVFSISATTASAYTYTIQSTVSSPASGTPVSTLAIISDITDVNGQVTDQRTFTTDQPVTGWVRKSTTSPYYKQQPISDTISSATGKEITVLLIRDE